MSGRMFPPFPFTAAKETARCNRSRRFPPTQPRSSPISSASAKASAYEKQRSRREVEARRAEGLCAKCGKAPAVEGRASCEPCLEKRRADDRARYAAGKAAGLKYGGANAEAKRRSGRAKSKRRQKARRELEIRDFVAVRYFEVVADAHAGDGVFRMRHAPKERIVERARAQVVIEAARGFEGLLRVRVESRRQRPPRLHDLPSLQKLASARFGWSASKTLEVAQELYDGAGKKILTYGNRS